MTTSQSLAEIVAEPHGLKPHPEDGLRERWCGDWVGTPSANSDWRAAPPNNGTAYGPVDATHPPIARSPGWHSRSNVTPYFRQASKTGANRSTRSSRLTSRTSGIGQPPIDFGRGGNSKKWLQQWAGEPTKPGTATVRSWCLPR